MIPRWAATLVLLVTSLALPATAAAHAELVASDPADGAILATAPVEVELRFGGELDPDGSGFEIIGPAGQVAGTGEVDLDVPDRDVMRGALDTDGGGRYEVRWTATSIDGHAEEGTLTFTVGTAEAPNTALPAPTAAGPAGMLVLLAAALVVLRRRAVLLLIGAVLLAGCVSANRPENCDAERVSIDLVLTASELSPSDPAVCREQEVTLVVDARTDGVLHIHGYDEAVPATTVEAGRTISLEFVATRSGQFPIELHPGDGSEGVDVGILTVDEP